MRINIENLLKRLEELYQIGKQPDGTHTRMAFSQEDQKARHTFIDYGKMLGLSHRIDEAGNIFLRLEGKNPNLPTIIIGSHLDTVPDGGKYDGVLGCLAGLSVQETFIKAQKTPNHPIETVVFTDEEGFRFGKGLLGSLALCGKDLDIKADEKDIYGNLRADILKNYGLDLETIQKAKRDTNTVHCFLELHIEQGARLYKKNCPIGIVSSIAGVDRYEITVVGEANHAGSTTMEDRKDALVAAADFIHNIPKIVKQYGNEFTVATVGTIQVTPYSVNVIPGSCTFSLEIRDAHAEIMEIVKSKLQDLLKDLCESYRTTYSWTEVSKHHPAPMDSRIAQQIELSAQELNLPFMIIPSGAFHDSLIMSDTFPTGMIFVPSKNGISHSKYEFTEPDDIEKGCNLLLQTICKLDELTI